jgi:hypothetical protein
MRYTIKTKVMAFLRRAVMNPKMYWYIGGAVAAAGAAAAGYVYRKAIHQAGKDAIRYARKKVGR